MEIAQVVDRPSLERYIATTDWPDFIYFWGHTPTDTQIGKHILSQWWPACFKIAGLEYATAEHFMMSEKARIFGDDATRSLIQSAASPSAAKALGRTVKGYDDTRWSALRFEVAYRGNLAKFSQNAELRQWLLSTKHHILVEASPVDTIWGIGLGIDDAAVHPEDWKGLNLLGFALMKVRATLREEDAIVGEVLEKLEVLYWGMKVTKWIRPEQLDQALVAAGDLTRRTTYFLSHRSDLRTSLERLTQVLVEPDCYCRRDAAVQAEAGDYARRFIAVHDRIARGECDPQ